MWMPNKLIFFVCTIHYHILLLVHVAGTEVSSVVE